MKIAHLINSLSSGGAEKLLVDVQPSYVERGHSVDVIQLTSKNEVKEYADILRSAGVGVISLSAGSLRNINLLIKIRVLLKSADYDIIHVHLFPTLYYVALASIFIGSKTKLIYTEHSNSNRRAKIKFLKYLERFIYGRYHKIIAISSTIADRLKSSIALSNNKLTIISNGVNIAKFSNALPYSEEEFYELFKIRTENKIKVGMVARFYYPKDHKTLVKAVAELNPRVELFLVGDGSLIDETKSYVNLLGLEKRVHFLGFFNDIPRFMKSMDVNVLSSEYEGVSGVTLEALASGRGFLGSNVKGINDIVINRKFLFEFGDDLELRLKINNLISDSNLNNQLIAEGLSLVAEYSNK